MKKVRVFYKKGDRMRFMSHLDMNRFMTRAVTRAKLPIWYTEGFNPHPYITFALPLPLGFETEYDVMDIRVTEDDYDLDILCQKLNAVCPEYIRFLRAAEPEKKAGEVAFAEYEILFDDKGEIKENLKEFLALPHIICKKKTKKGDIKELDVSEKIVSVSFDENEGDTKLSITLPAGSADNLNPEIILNSFFEDNNYYCYKILRKAILDSDKKPFI